MSTERTIELIHGEIDGTNSPRDSLELRKTLERDVPAREFHEDMKRLTGVLDRVDDVEVPAHLRTSIRSAIAAQRNNRQLLAAGVLVHAQRKFFELGREIMAKKQVFALVGIAVIALVAVTYFGVLQRPKDDEVAGAIGAAQRYNADQTTDTDVVLSDQEIQTFMQSEVFHQLLEDPEFAKLITDPEFAKLAAQPDFTKIIADPRFATELMRLGDQFDPPGAGRPVQN